MNKNQTLAKIRKQLETCKDPLFFYDDDPDGLSSYLLLQKFVQKGKGIVLKMSMQSDQDFILRKISEYKPDSVFILDRAIVDQDMIDQITVPVTLIDHHTPLDLKGITYFNPLTFGEKNPQPTSYWCYKIVKQNIWIAMVGCVSDWYIPDFKKQFNKGYPDYLSNTKDPAKALHETKIGKLGRIFWFCLKGRTSEMKKCVNTLLKIEHPAEILDQTTPRGKFVYKYYHKVDNLYQNLLNQAKKGVTRSKLLLFTYPSSRISLTAILANELLYLYPEKIIIIARQKNDKMIMSLRSANHPILSVLKLVLEQVNGYGGGHKFACGATVDKDQFPEFIKKIKEAI